jgi:hypothetical protein
MAGIGRLRWCRAVRSVCGGLAAPPAFAERAPDAVRLGWIGAAIVGGRNNWRG